MSQSATQVSWSVVGGTGLDTQLLYDVLALRSAVFVVEQECAYQDIDGLDLVEGTVHVLGRDGDGIAAYARVLAPDAEHATPRIGRVIVAAQARGRAAGPRADGAGRAGLRGPLAGPDRAGCPGAPDRVLREPGLRARG